MNSIKLFLLVGLIITVNCTEDKQEDSIKISKTEIYLRLKSNNLELHNADLYDFSGKKYPIASIHEFDADKWAFDYYKNENGIISMIKARPLKIEDRILQILENEYRNNSRSEYKIVEINCSELNSIYNKIEADDQNARNGIGDVQIVDSINQELVISAIDKCGFATQHLKVIWLVFQHANKELIARYYPELKNYSEAGKLGKKYIAMMEDRLLMWNGYSQIYGTQLMNHSLYKLDNPETVNERRKKMDLGPIEDYISYWNLDFENEILKMTKKNDR